MTATPLTADDRFELAMLATQRERSNRPVWVLAAGTAALVLTGCFTLWAWSAYASSRSRLNSQATLTAGIVSNIDYLRELDNLGKTGPDKTVEPFNALISTIQTAAVSVGLTSIPSAPNQQLGREMPSGLRQNIYAYDNVRSPKVETLLNWVEKSLKDVPGLSVREVVLKRDANGWTLRAVFSRLEKVS